MSQNTYRRNRLLQGFLRVGRTLLPALFAFTCASVAHAQGTMDFSGAQTLMTTFKTFAVYAGAVICFGGLIFAGIRMMSGRFQDAIPGLFGALFGAGVLAQMNGQSVQAHLGRYVSDIVPPSTYKQFELYLRRAIRGEAFPSIEVQTAPETTGESAKTLMVSYQPVRDEVGEILGVCVSIADITVMKQKEDALRESEDHYRHAVELNPQTPWVMDAHGDNISVSSRREKITGLTSEHTKGYGWLDAVHPDDRPRVRAILESSLITGAAIDVEYRVRHADGPWIWMRSRGAARRDATGTIIRWYGSVESIDEHKRAIDELRRSEADLRCSEARLRAIFDSVPVGIVLAESSTGRVLNANPKAEELIGSTSSGT